MNVVVVGCGGGGGGFCGVGWMCDGEMMCGVCDGGVCGGECVCEDDVGECVWYGATACAARGGDGWTRGSGVVCVGCVRLYIVCKKNGYNDV